MLLFFRFTPFISSLVNADKFPNVYGGYFDFCRCSARKKLIFMGTKSFRPPKIEDLIIFLIFFKLKDKIDKVIAWILSFFKGTYRFHFSFLKMGEYHHYILFIFEDLQLFFQILISLRIGSYRFYCTSFLPARFGNIGWKLTML